MFGAEYKVSNWSNGDVKYVRIVEYAGGGGFWAHYYADKACEELTDVFGPYASEHDAYIDSCWSWGWEVVEDYYRIAAESEVVA